MDGTVAERSENLRRNPPKYPVSNPPVGEYCIALLRNSADVNASPARLNDRPETSLLAPYLAMMLERNQPGTAGASMGLVNEVVRRAALPENINANDAIQFGKTNPRFTATLGVALDAAFTQTVNNARLPKPTIPPITTRNLEELYAVTDRCFRPGASQTQATTFGQCADAGRDQAALYLHGRGTTLASEPSAPSARQPPRR